MKREKNIEISELWISSYLLAKGYSLQAYLKKMDGFVSFLFEDKDNTINENLRAYHNNEATVDPKRFVRAYRDLKVAVLQARQGGK